MTHHKVVMSHLAKMIISNTEEIARRQFWAWGQDIEKAMVSTKVAWNHGDPCVAEHLHVTGTNDCCSSQLRYKTEPNNDTIPHFRNNDGASSSAAADVAVTSHALWPNGRLRRQKQVVYLLHLDDDGNDDDGDAHAQQLRDNQADNNTQGRRRWRKGVLKKRRRRRRWKRNLLKKRTKRKEKDDVEGYEEEEQDDHDGDDDGGGGNDDERGGNRETRQWDDDDLFFDWEDEEGGGGGDEGGSLQRQHKHDERNGNAHDDNRVTTLTTPFFPLTPSRITSTTSTITC